MIQTQFCPINNRPKGWSVTFDNGLTISVMYGYGNYCEHRNTTQPPTHSTNAEICIWNTSYRTIDFGGDGVRGYCSPEDIARIMYLTSIATDLHTLQQEFNTFGISKPY